MDSCMQFIDLFISTGLLNSSTISSITSYTANNYANSMMTVSKRKQDNLHIMYVFLLYHHMEHPIRVIVIDVVKIDFTKSDIFKCSTVHEYLRPASTCVCS
jgi:hypothetical protein